MRFGEFHKHGGLRQCKGGMFRGVCGHVYTKKGGHVREPISRDHLHDLELRKSEDA